MLQCVLPCCSVLQCVALWCSVLQCDAVCCSVLHCDAALWRQAACCRVAVCCSVLQCVAECCCVLQCVAVCCSRRLVGSPQLVLIQRNLPPRGGFFFWVISQCNARLKRRSPLENHPKLSTLSHLETIKKENTFGGRGGGSLDQCVDVAVCCQWKSSPRG